MPLFMDIHELHGADPKAVAEAHAADVGLQAKYGVEYTKYWLNKEGGKLFCLCHAPSADAAERVHREAHGLVAERIIRVDADVAEAFLGDGTDIEGEARIGDKRDTAIRTVVFTDIVESTSLTQRVGDTVAMEFIALHDIVVRNALTLTGGREVKHTGDGIMASFHSAEDAMHYAARIQSDLTSNSFVRGGMRLQVRVGAAAGEPVERHNDLFGSTVQLAARLCNAAAPDEVLVSDSVTALCTAGGFRFVDRGGMTLKGFDQPQHSASLNWRLIDP
jgi:class 3 adenylate cyclase